MAIEKISVDQAVKAFVDDLAARRFEEEVLFAGPSQVTDEERQQIRRILDQKGATADRTSRRLDAFVAMRQAALFDDCHQTWQLAAATGRPVPPAAKEFEDVRFVFVSDTEVPPDQSWRAELELPGTAASGDMLRLKVQEADGREASKGLLAIAGTTLMVEDGEAELPLDLFLIGIRNAAVSFQREGGAPVPGSMVFF